ncbi:hypothetical protein HN51_043691 [Arachis hypogaea]
MIIAISPTREFLVKQAEIHNLYWHGYRFSSLPLNFEHYDNLVELNLPGSSIKRLWEGRKVNSIFTEFTLPDKNGSEQLERAYGDTNFECCPSLK